MFSKKLAIWFVVLMGVLSVYGCSRKANPPAAATEPVKTAAEYKAEADKQIDEKNMTQELSKLEQEVEVDATAEQTAP